jgi:hypothetical protein
MFTMRDVYVAEQRFEEMRREAEQRNAVRCMLADRTPVGPTRIRRWIAGAWGRFRRTANAGPQRQPAVAGTSYTPRPV